MNSPCLLFGGRLYPLPEDADFLIGRAAESGLVIPDDRISRKHAFIRARHGRFFITDLDSMNGTFVNGERVKGASPLVPGDEILILPYQMLFVLSTEDGTTIGERPAGASSPVRAGNHFSGLLRTLRLSDLIQLLHSTLQSGILTIHDGRGSMGQIHLIQGEIDQARFGEKSADRAVYEMLALRDGDFEFAPGNPTPEKAITSSTMSLLLEGCRLIDEGGRGKTQSIKI